MLGPTNGSGCNGTEIIHLTQLWSPVLKGSTPNTSPMPKARHSQSGGELDTLGVAVASLRLKWKVIPSASTQCSIGSLVGFLVGFLRAGLLRRYKEINGSQVTRPFDNLRKQLYIIDNSADNFGIKPKSTRLHGRSLGSHWKTPMRL